MAFGQDDPVVQEVLGVVRVELETCLIEEKNGEDLDDGCARGRMTTLGHMHSQYGIDPQPVCNIFIQ